MNTEKTGQMIATARKAKGLTQKALAEKLHISDRTVSKWERGAGFPDVALLEPLARELDLPLTALIRGETLEEPTEAACEEVVTDSVGVAAREIHRKLRRVRRAILAAVLILALAALWLLIPPDVTTVTYIPLTENERALTSMHSQVVTRFELNATRDVTYVRLFAECWTPSGLAFSKELLEGEPQDFQVQTKGNLVLSHRGNLDSYRTPSAVIGLAAQNGSATIEFQPLTLDLGPEYTGFFTHVLATPEPYTVTENGSAVLLAWTFVTAEGGSPVSCEQVSREGVADIPDDHVVLLLRLQFEKDRK